MDLSILKPGKNCWRVEEAPRAAFLIDGEKYFAAVRAAATRAQHSIMILGWEFDTRTRMMIDQEPDGFPDPIGEFIRELLHRHRRLQVYVLTWDHHLIYSAEREWIPFANLFAPRRLQSVKDGAHPVGASHHQKIVVIDDAVAFVGGMDFAQCRWDTSAHRIDHPQRQLMDGKPCRPFHDVQIMVDGNAARALGELARERWENATGDQLSPPVVEAVGDRWPPSVSPDFRMSASRSLERDPNMRVSRRSGKSKRYSSTRSNSLSGSSTSKPNTSPHMSSHRHSRTACEIPEGQRLSWLLHPNSDGWLEQHTMDVLRGRVLKRLRGEDRFHRLGLYFPHLPGSGNECISMHAKVCVIDEILFESVLPTAAIARWDSIPNVIWRSRPPGMARSSEPSPTFGIDSSANTSM